MMRKSMPSSPKLPMVSVIIPCFNGEAYIAGALQSVLAQQWPELEIIVVDDGSTDGSAARVAREFPGVVVVRQQNQGVAAARNHGIRCARGEWLAFLDADDAWLPGKLQAQWQALVADPEARMSYTGWHVWHSDVPDASAGLADYLRTSGRDDEESPGASGWIYTSLLEDCVVWTSTVLVHRSVLDEVGVFDANLRIGEDYDLWLRASRVTKILRVPKAYALYRMHPSNLTRKVPAMNYKGMVVTRAIERWGYESPDGTVADRTRVSSGLARSWSDFAGAQLMGGASGTALRSAALSLKVYPWQMLGWTVLLKALFSPFKLRGSSGG